MEKFDFALLDKEKRKRSDEMVDELLEFIAKNQSLYRHPYFSLLHNPGLDLDSSLWYLRAGMDLCVGQVAV